jgi:hypothetical protein
LHPAITSFLADPDLGDDPSDLAQAFLILDRDSIDNASARSLLKTFTWIVQQERPLMEKLAAMDKVLAFAKSRAGTHCLIPSLRRFLDWPAP